MDAPESAAEWVAFTIDRLVELAAAWPLALVVVLFLFRNKLAEAARLVGRELRDRHVEARGPGGTALVLGDRISRDEVEDDIARARAERGALDETREAPADLAAEIVINARSTLWITEENGAPGHVIVRADVLVFLDERDQQVARTMPVYPADAVLAMLVFISKRHDWNAEPNLWRTVANRLRALGVPVSEQFVDAGAIEAIREARQLGVIRYDYPTEVLPDPPRADDEAS